MPSKLYATDPVLLRRSNDGRCQGQRLREWYRFRRRFLLLDMSHAFVHCRGDVPPLGAICTSLELFACLLDRMLHIRCFDGLLGRKRSTVARGDLDARPSPSTLPIRGIRIDRYKQAASEYNEANEHFHDEPPTYFDSFMSDPFGTSDIFIPTGSPFGFGFCMRVARVGASVVRSFGLLGRKGHDQS
jgi:hypothetical protein